MEMQEVKFGFKETTKRIPDVTGKLVPAKDEKGNEIKIPAPKSVSLSIPQFSTKEDLLAIANSEDEKQVKLAVEALNAVILAQVKEQIEDARKEEADLWTGQEEDDKGNITKSADGSFLDMAKLEWSYIAALPPGTRGAQAIPEEEWNDFAADYKTVIVHHGKTSDQAEAGAKLLLKKFAPVKMNKKVVGALKENLLVWYANSSEASRFQKIYENLLGKANTLMQADEEAIVAAV